MSRICGDLDAEVAAFADRSLADTAFPYVLLDATYCKARIGGGKGGKGSRVASQAVVVATGMSADSRREILGFAVGEGEDRAFWTAFLRSLKTRGLHGTQVVISDVHVGLKSAIAAVMVGAAWRRSSDNICSGGVFPLARLRHRERTLAAWPSRSSGRPVSPGGGRP